MNFMQVSLRLPCAIGDGEGCELSPSQSIVQTTNRSMLGSKKQALISPVLSIHSQPRLNLSPRDLVRKNAYMAAQTGQVSGEVPADAHIPADVAL
jgi:hypothetical protein